MTTFSPLHNIQNLRKSCIKSLQESDKDISVWFHKTSKQRDEFQQLAKDWGDVFSLYNKEIQKEVTVLDDVQNKFEESLQNENSSIERLVFEESVAVRKLEDLKNQIRFLHNDSHKQCKEVYSLYRTKMRLYKQFTLTNFLFNSVNVYGMIRHNEIYKVFDMDPKTVKEQDLMSCLWSLLEEIISFEKWSDIVDM